MTEPPGGLTLRRAAWAAALVAFVLHLGLGAGGAWSFELLNYDDPQVVALASDTSVAEILSQPVWYAYKPVYFLSLKIDTLFGDAAVGVGHVHNVLLHALAAALLVLVLRGLVRSTWIAFAVGLLFAVHPVHVESVAWLSGRKDVLSLVFVLIAHLQYRRARAEGGTSFSAPVFLVLGGLTKGTVWVWAGVLLLDEIVEGIRAHSDGEPWPLRAVVRRWWPCGTVALLGVALDATMAIRHGPGAVDHGVSTMALAAAMAGVHLRYVFNVFLPFRLSIDYAVDPGGSWASPLTWTGLLLLVAGVALFVLAIRRRRPTWAVASGLWLLGLLPVNNLWPRTAILMADRYLYVAAAGIGVLTMAALARWRAGRNLVLAVLVVVLGGLTLHRTTLFASSESVWADATSKQPASALAWFQRGQDAAARGAWDDAVRWSRRALELHPRPEIRVKTQLLETGALLGRLGQEERAGRRVDEAKLREVLEAAKEGARLANALEELPLVREAPRQVQAEALVLLGKVLERWRDPASALRAYEQATRLWEAHATAHYDYATLLAGLGTEADLELAEHHLQRALKHRPDFLDARIQLATVVALRGRMQDALAILKQAERRHGRTADLLFAQAQVHLAARQDVARAEELLQELKRKDPNHPKASKLLSDIRLAQGRILLEQGRDENDRAKLRDALERFDAAARVRERNWDAEVGAGDVLVRLGRYRAARERFEQALGWSDRLPWVRRLAARAAVLEAAYTARYAEDDVDRDRAARLMAGAIRAPLSRLDLGFLSYREELDWLRKVAERLDAEGEAGLHAARVLRAAALAATGDDGGAHRELRGVFSALSANTEERDVLDTAILLRGLLQDRARDVEAATSDYRLLVERRPDAPLPRLRQLQARLDRARRDVKVASAGDREALARAAGEQAAAVEAIQAFADEHPDVLSAGLLATEADMHSGRWTQALRRLNDLLERHPREPSVYRGLSAIYVSQYLATLEPALIKEGERALRQALTLDPRDPQTLLDASQLARVAKNLQRALDYARRARTHELVPSGPAARALADLYIAAGRQRLEAGDVKQVMQAVEQARRADPGSAAPWLLKGDALLRFQKTDEAVAAYRTAKELEPWSRKVAKGLAKAHAEQARRYRVTAASVRTPPHPREADAEAWEAMDDAERREATSAWGRQLEQVRKFRERYKRQEVRALEAALRLDPDAEDAGTMSRRLETLKSSDPAVRRRAYQDAQALYEQGVQLLEEEKFSEALERFQQATDRFSDHLPAHFYTARTVLALLSAGTAETDEEVRIENDWWLLAFEAVHATDALDPLDRFPDRYRVRAQLHDLQWRRRHSEIDRIAARRAYERYIRAMEALEREDEPGVAAARRRLAELE